LITTQVGDALDFKHISFNIKVQYPFNKKTITMIGGGTGITPLYQALQKIMENPEDKTAVNLLLGNNTPDDILLRKELDEMVQKSEGRINVVHVLSALKDDDKWEGERGFVNLELISRYAPPPSDDTMVFVCGPPPMYASLCGPRDVKEVAEGTALHSLGYNSANVFKF
jgi:cytochrome-b5 reductase